MPVSKAESLPGSAAPESPSLSRCEYPALHSIRVGCVKYLNARPLISDYDGPVLFRHPSELAVDIAEGRLDAALVPVFEGLGDRRYWIADGAAIASNGPVYSVYIAYRGELSDIQVLALDQASLTSVHLSQVILAEFYGIHPQCVPPHTPDADARLLIGNQAIEFRANPSAGWRFLDLGEEWTRRTQLPFVYAVWFLRPDAPNVHAAAAEFRLLKERGVRRIPEIVRDDKIGTQEFRHRYLTEHIRFDLGTSEKAGLRRFAELLHKHRFISALPDLEYI